MRTDRLDRQLVALGLASSRSQAENLIRLGQVEVNSRVVEKTSLKVSTDDKIRLLAKEQYVSRAGFKLASVVENLGVEFRGKVVLDVGSSTGGFTDYALQHGARKVVAVDVGTDQLHLSLRGDDRVELYEKTDIRDVLKSSISELPDIIVVDVSFISLREILPHLAQELMSKKTELVAMVKPQFEAGRGQVSKGVIKNDKIRRQTLADFEAWAKSCFVILDKRDSQVAGAKGNLERFYLLQKTM